jgi:hypothetical protein
MSKVVMMLHQYQRHLKNMHYQCDTSETCTTDVNDPAKLGILIGYFWLVSKTPIRHDLAGVNDTGKECINGINDTGEVMHCRCR